MQADGFFDVSRLLRSGVYLLCWHGEVVYVGQSKKMLTRVYTHMNMYLRKQRSGAFLPRIPVKGIRFDEVLVQPCLASDLDRLEREMIVKYNPVFNVNFKPKTKKEFPIKILGIEYVMNGTLTPKPVSESAGVLRRI